MSRLHIVFYDKFEAHYLPSCTDQFLAIKNPSDKIFHLINKEKFNDGSLSAYRKLYKDYENINHVFIQDFDIPIKDLLKNEIQKYENILIYSCKLSFTNKLKNTLNNIGFIVPENNMSISMGSYNRQGVIDIIRTDQTMSNIKYVLENGVENNPNHKTDFLIDSSKIIKSADNANDSVFYEDDNCLFCVLGARETISRSAAYLNKNNKKIFNINNNIFGNVMQYSGSFISVDWKIGTNNKACYYHKYNGNFDN